MMPTKKVPVLVKIERRVGGVLQETYPFRLADEDPIRAARYSKLAQQGDLQAKAQLDEMENTQMMQMVTRSK